MTKRKNDSSMHKSENYPPDTFLVRGRHVLLAIGIIGFIGTLIAGYFISQKIITDTQRNNEFPSVITPNVLPTMTTSPLLTRLLADTASGMDLREESNVVHLAYLRENGSALYAVGSVTWNDPVWSAITMRPTGISNLSVDETTVTLEWMDQTFSLNVYQPFILDGQLATLYMVAVDGSMQQAPADRVDIVPLVEARAVLPLTIEPNPTLSLSF